MKILHVISYYQEGMGYQENWLPYFQKKLGHEVLVVTSDRYFPFPDYDKNVGKILGIRLKEPGLYYCKGVKILRLKSIFEIESKASVVFNSKKVIIDFSPDIVHLHGITNLNFFQFILYSLHKKYKLFIDSHSDYQVSNYQSLTNKVYYKIWSFFYRLSKNRIACFLPTTSEAKEFLRNEFSIIDRDAKINHLGVNTDRFYFDESASRRVREQFNLNQGIVFVNAGKQNESKKIVFILKVIKELIIKFSHDDIFIILIGDADDDYNKLLSNESSDISEHVIRVPFQKNEKLRDFYSAADIGIWPGVPSNTIQEAMACEVAMILPNNKTIDHLIDENGIIMPELCFETVAEHIHKIIKSNCLEKYKKKSREIALNYSWENIAKKSVSIYEEK
ncbi:glycosyltransferase family 4 protein [Vibrio sp. Of14-4]|nr:glycosyltransferase family 4 protein [Vibrio sp. Of14-4]